MPALERGRRARGRPAVLRGQLPQAAHDGLADVVDADPGDLLPEEVGPAYRLGLLCFQEGNFPCAQQWFEKVLTKAIVEDNLLSAADVAHGPATSRRPAD